MPIRPVLEAVGEGPNDVDRDAVHVSSLDLTSLPAGSLPDDPMADSQAVDGSMPLELNWDAVNDTPEPTPATSSHMAQTLHPGQLANARELSPDPLPNHQMGGRQVSGPGARGRSGGQTKAAKTDEKISAINHYSPTMFFMLLGLGALSFALAFGALAIKLGIISRFVVAGSFVMAGGKLMGAAVKYRKDKMNEARVASELAAKFAEKKRQRKLAA